MKKLSTGHDSTLKNYRMMTVTFFGDDSPAVEFLDKTIKDSPNGEDEEVLADEGQMVNALAHIHFAGEKKKGGL